jgi:hypothetical protein
MTPSTRLTHHLAPDLRQPGLYGTVSQPYIRIKVSFAMVFAVSDAEVDAGAGGRARSNRERQLRARIRRSVVVRRDRDLASLARPRPSSRVRSTSSLARRTHDIQRWADEGTSRCPTCLSPIGNDDWDFVTEVRQRTVSPARPPNRTWSRPHSARSESVPGWDMQRCSPDARSAAL